MIIMNKLYKCALGLLTTFILSIACFSNAENIKSLVTYIGNENTISIRNNYYKLLDLTSSDRGNTYCLEISSVNNVFFFGYNSSLTNNTDLSYAYINNGDLPYMCITYNSYHSTDYLFIYYPYNDKNLNLTYKLFELNALFNTQIPVTSSIECQQEYNLIPINEVTANYCAVNFGMIDPQECPINQGTGAIVRSNLMINDIPYAQNQNINVFIPDFLAWNIAFNDLYTTIEVEGYNADEEYIENIINQEKLTPTNKDIEDMLTGFMTNYFPYLALAIVFLYLARKIFKLFK